MTRKIYLPLLVGLLSVFNVLTAEAIFLREYTEDHPLVIVSDWEFPPYEFRNDKGEPDGYNVETLDLILTSLNIPHQFVMQEWYKCAELFENREADLIHGLAYLYTKRPFVMTQNMITYYNVRAVRLKSTTPLDLNKLTEKDTIILKKNDYAAIKLLEREDSAFAIEYKSTREALMGIRSGKYQYYIWGEMPVSLKIRELGLDSLALDETNIPSGELRIIGYDKELIDAIDDAYARLEQSGELEKIRDKWFHPDRVHNDASPITLIILAGIVIVLIIVFLLSRLIRSRVKAAVHKSLDLNQMMAQALSMGKFSVVVYDIKNNILRNQYGDMLPEKGLAPQEFLARMKPDQVKQLHQMNMMLVNGEKKQFDMHLSLNWGTAEEPRWNEYYGNAISESEGGHVKYIIYSIKDISQEIEEERTNKEVGSKYMKMFETNLVAMSFYDGDGVLIDVNDKMRKLCGFDKEGEKFFRKLNMFDVPLFKGQFDFQSRDVFYVCQHMSYPDIGIDKYIEFKIRPTFDEDDKLRYYIVTARDLTAERTMYLEQRRHDREIHEASKRVSLYEQQLYYLLDNSNMFIWNYYLDDDMIHFSRSSRTDEYVETLDKFLGGVDEQDREKAFHDVRTCVASGQPYSAIHHFSYTHLEPKPVWYAVNGVPQYDKDGRLIKYFGISRNITNLMDAQQKLKKEMARAENSGKMKSAFLANMTHEIRTPLNAIVGFSDILPMVDTKEERMEFIRIIRNNCDMLMRLINDILEASNMGQALAIKPTTVDFAQVFDDICQTLEQRVQEPGVEFIKDNPYPTYVTTLDKGRVQQILTNFTTNAVKYTHNGHIKVGYHYEQRVPANATEKADGLYFYCEDTGAGIPKEKQASVFERFVKLNDFVQGTGLGLSICQAIADRCNGHIGVTSEGEGHGSTFWLWIPCEKNTQNP